MKSTILFLTVILVFAISYAQEYKEYYSIGKLKISDNFDSIKKQSGEWKYYYQNEEICQVFTYENGNKTCKWRCYRKNGKFEGAH